MSTQAALTAELVEMGLNRPYAHDILFAHRHTDLLGRAQASAPFQVKMAEDWAGPEQFVLDMVFRGGAKSTIAEESIITGALYVDFTNALLIGYSQAKAKERLAAIRHEFKTNDLIQTLFGAAALLDVDSEDEIVTANKVRIKALGRGQSLRGIKWLDRRPDMIFIDDLEDLADVATPEARKKVFDWLTRVLLPAADPMGRVRMAATPLHPDAAPERLEKDDAWKVRRVPIYYADVETGELKASWPERFPLDYCLKLQDSYRVRGELENFKQEYMCQAENPETKPFRREMINIFPQVKTWQASYSMTDPARTVKAGSATTGHAVWSWINDKLVIWDAWAKKLLPSEIVSAMFQSYEDYKTIWAGVEEDGLNEFLLQPIRQEMVRRGVALPYKPMKAPPSKLNFIKGLQPFFLAREVQFAKAMPDLETQLLGFPTGAIDAPNALAYALKMRPGAPLYDAFGPRHIVEDLQPANGRHIWLCLNASYSMVTAMAVQSIDGAIRILADFVREGDPTDVLSDIIAAAQLECGRSVRLVAGLQHWDRYNNVGLVAAARRIPIEVRTGADLPRGREALRSLLQRERQTQPLVAVSDQATWTLNGFVGGYSRALVKGGTLADHAELGPYQLLMEGLEAFVSLLEVGSPEDDDGGRVYSMTRDGRRYVSTLGSRGR